MEKVINIKRVVILGASFDTGNLGVSALAWSSIKLILRRWPDAEVSIWGTGRHPGSSRFVGAGITKNISLWPVRYSPKLWVKNHVLQIGFWLLVIRLIPYLKKYFCHTDSSLGVLLRTDVIFDITGGDSFSDIYGLQRFIRDFLLKQCCLWTKKPFILLPQTYGPYKSLLSRVLARRVLKRVRHIYSRDQEGRLAVEGLIGKQNTVMFCPDVAFVLDVIRPNTAQAQSIEKLKADGQKLVGLNISGLLYSGGYTQDNMFGLACDYPATVRQIICHFINLECVVVLVPHVVSEDIQVENDYYASRAVFDLLSAAEREKVILLDGSYDQNEIKYLIGRCDFFIGARMHATIAALSQQIPAVGMAYSKKFKGVFDTAGIVDCVVELRQEDESSILRRIDELYKSKVLIQQQLACMIPNVLRQINDVFNRI